MHYKLKNPTNFRVAPQSVCQDENPDQDEDFTLKFNTRTTFYTFYTITKVGLDPLTSSKVIVSMYEAN